MRGRWRSTAICALCFSLHGAGLAARNHVSNCIDDQNVDWILQRYVVMCSVNTDPNGTVQIFTRPSLSAEYTEGVGNAPPDYLDMVVDYFGQEDGVQFLCGKATNTNGYAVVRNTQSSGQVVVETDWCILSRDASCELRAPGMITENEPFSNEMRCSVRNGIEDE